MMNAEAVVAQSGNEAAVQPPAVRFEGISKRFGGTVALDDVSFDVASGAVHALLGGNGSGKSTLIKILSGVYRADSGWVEVNGHRHAADHTTADWARAVNVHVVHQGIGIFPDLSVADNFALSHGYGARTFGPIASRKLFIEVQEKLTYFELDVSPRARMGELPAALQTMVAVARALPSENEAGAILVLDEPTAALPPSQEHMLLEAIRGYKRRGQTVILVTHRLDEVVAVADDVTFLRDGRFLETSRVQDIDERVMVGRIAGMEQAPARRAPRTAPRGQRLELRDVSVGPLKEISLSAGEGEILGLSGLHGSGRSNLMLSLFGVEKSRTGEVLLDGKLLRVIDPADAVGKRIAYLSAERQREGVFMDQSVRENLSIPDLQRYWRRLWLQNSEQVRDARKVIRDYRVVVASEEGLISSMSGGNQQKVALARWLELKPRLLLLNEPTQGVDVGARAAIHQLIRDAADAGTTVLVASSDPRELAELCDRVVGLYKGAVSGEAAGDELTAHRCLQLANGGG